jgi:hypothetical protein
MDDSVQRRVQLLRNTRHMLPFHVPLITVTGEGMSLAERDWTAALACSCSQLPSGGPPSETVVSVSGMAAPAAPALTPSKASGGFLSRIFGRNQGSSKPGAAVVAPSPSSTPYLPARAWAELEFFSRGGTRSDES